jgi:SAM-dependent methyltransferase
MILRRWNTSPPSYTQEPPFEGHRGRAFARDPPNRAGSPRMHIQHRQLLRYPNSGGELELRNEKIVDDRVESGTLIDQDGREFPIRSFIPRFVDAQNYCDPFTVEWRRYPDILSSYSGHQERFEKETRWGQDLTGQLILEAGCGPGAFTRSALATGATVVSFDYSGSVDVSYAANGGSPNLLIIQADIFAMPLPDAAFDKIFCFGVLQHTQDPKRAFLNLVRKLRPGGAIATDIYPPPPKRHPYSGILRSKYFIRRFTAGKSPETLHRWVSAYIDLMWPLASLIRRSKHGLQISRRLLIDDPRLLRDMAPSRYKEFAKLNLFDMLAPVYDIPATVEAFASWHHEAGLEGVAVGPGYNGVEGHGFKPV